MCWLLEGDAGGLGDKSADTISVVHDAADFSTSTCRSRGLPCDLSRS